MFTPDDLERMIEDGRTRRDAPRWEAYDLRLADRVELDPIEEGEPHENPLRLLGRLL